jgi:uncharacterized Ntn-hydrolase superfamily protein
MSSKMYWLRTPADSLGRINQRLVAAATTVSAATAGVTAIATSDVKHTRYGTVRVCCVATARRASPFVHEIAEAEDENDGEN